MQAHLTIVADGLKLSGMITWDNLRALRQQGEKLIGKGPAAIKMDLANIRVQGSGILSLLLCWQRCAQDHGKVIHFVHSPLSLRQLAQLTATASILGL